MPGLKEFFEQAKTKYDALKTSVNRYWAPLRKTSVLEQQSLEEQQEYFQYQRNTILGDFSKEDRTLLEAALFDDLRQLDTQILEKADINAKSRFNQQSILMAIAEYNAPLTPYTIANIGFLINMGADMNYGTQGTCVRFTPFHIALYCAVSNKPNWPIIEALIANGVSLKQEVRPLIGFDFFGSGRLEVEKPSTSVIKEFCFDKRNPASYPDLMMFNRILSTQLNNIKKAINGSNIVDYITLSFLSPANNPRYIKQLEKENRRIEAEIKRRENTTYLRLITAVSAFGLIIPYIPIKSALCLTGALLTGALNALGEKDSFEEDITILATTYNNLNRKMESVNEHVPHSPTTYFSL